MNNTCPTCGAIYNVATKDIGRKLRCKKCSASLKVTDAGLELESPAASLAAADSRSVPAGAAAAAEIDEPFDQPIVRKKGRGSRGAGMNLGGMFAPIGGIPGLLFCIGVFFALFFAFLQALSGASNERASEYKRKLELERDIKVRKLLPKGKIDPSQLEGAELTKFNEERKKIEDEYILPLREADEDQRATEISNRRSRVFEGYGLMFGMMLISFACLGFLLTDTAIILRIMAGVILVAIVMGLFKFGMGVSGGVGAALNIG